jgi:alkylhydroperoxidase/carboxymuconolactone decarboxylase family protein YurZ
MTVHFKNALRVGVTPEEILATLEIVSLSGMNTMSDGVLILLEDARKRDKLPHESD